MASRVMVAMYYESTSIYHIFCNKTPDFGTLLFTNTLFIEHHACHYSHYNKSIFQAMAISNSLVFTVIVSPLAIFVVLCFE